MKKVLTLLLILILIGSLAACSSSSVSPADSSSSGFSIVGTWKNVGDTTHNQIQKGAIISFNGTNCNVVSPHDTYAFYQDGGSYRLDCTSVLGGTVSYKVEIIDNDNIHLITPVNTVIELTRVG